MWGTSSVRLREKIEISKTRSGRRKGVNQPEGAWGAEQRLTPQDRGGRRGAGAQSAREGLGPLVPVPPAAVSTLVHEGNTPSPSVLLTLRGHVISQRDVRRRLPHHLPPALRRAVFSVSTGVTCPGRI